MSNPILYIIKLMVYYKGCRNNLPLKLRGTVRGQNLNLLRPFITFHVLEKTAFVELSQRTQNKYKILLQNAGIVEIIRTCQKTKLSGVQLITH